jgi:hypothetical protein
MFNFRLLVDLDFGVFHLNYLSIWLRFQWPRGLLLYDPLAQERYILMGFKLNMSFDCQNS